MGLLAWIQKQFGISMNSENENNQEPTPAKEGKFKVLRIQPTPNPDAFQFIMNGKVIDGSHVIKSNDLISNRKHRHELPVVAQSSF